MKIKKSVLTFTFFLVIAVTTERLFAGGRPLGSDSVVFQTFYRDVPGGGTWYDTIRDRAPELKSADFTHFWFPPPTKGDSGGYSMDYDLGQYGQKGTVEIRFGSLSELQAAIAAGRPRPNGFWLSMCNLWPLGFSFYYEYRKILGIPKALLPSRKV